MTEITSSVLTRQSAVRVLAPLAMMALIFWFSSQHANEHLEWWEVVMRKVGHATAYAVLTALWTWALRGWVRRPLLWACAIALLYACSDEFHQTFVETRHGSPRDVLIDSVGIAVSALIIHATGSRAQLRTDHS